MSNFIELGYVQLATATLLGLGGLVALLQLLERPRRVFGRNQRQAHQRVPGVGRIAPLPQVVGPLVGDPAQVPVDLYHGLQAVLAAAPAAVFSDFRVVRNRQNRPGKCLAASSVHRHG